MVAHPGGTTASAKLWLPAFPDGMPASSRIEEPSAVMNASRCSRRTMFIETRLDPAMRSWIGLPEARHPAARDWRVGVAPGATLGGRTLFQERPALVRPA